MLHVTRSLALTIWEWRRFEDLEKSYLITTVFVEQARLIIDTIYLMDIADIINIMGITNLWCISVYY